MSFDLASLTGSDRLHAFVAARASLDPLADDTVIAFTGAAYGVVPGLRPELLLRVEGYSIARAVAADDGFDLYAREMLAFCDRATGRVIDHFDNPYTGHRDAVVHVWNDPVNQWLTEDGIVAAAVGDTVHFSHDELSLAPNPLSPATWPRESSGPTLACARLARFVTSAASVGEGKQSRERSAERAGTPCSYSCVLHEPWAPWMRMGEHPGTLVTYIGGAKLIGGYSALPPSMRSFVESNRPEFAFAPRTFVAPNETVWTRFAAEQIPYER